MKKLSEIYDEQSTFGTIKLTEDGLDIDGKLITNVIKDSVSIERFGGKTIVKCELMCDEFQSIHQ